MRYKNKEKFNRGIMKSIKKKQEKEEIKIIKNNLTSLFNDNINNNQNGNICNNNQNCTNNLINNNLKQNILERKHEQKESYLKKALDNMAKNSLNKSEDSQIFNMEKHDQITDNIILEKEKTNLISRKYLENKVSKNNIFKRKFTSNINNENKEDDNKLNIKNAFGNLKIHIQPNKEKAIDLNDPNINYNRNLLNDLDGPTIDFYNKRMDYLNNMYLKVKNNPFEYSESEGKWPKKKFSNYIPKSALISKERRDTFNVHLIKKFSDFKIPLKKQNSIKSKTANFKDKISNFFDIYSFVSLK